MPLNLDFLDRLIAQQAWLKPLEEPLQQAVNAAYASAGARGKEVKNFFNGVWLGHPLHPVLTDVPVGAWTSTMVLDLASLSNENPGMQQAADLSLATGLVAALPTAVSGLTDWSDTYGRERNVGLLHGVIMVGTVACYLISFLARRGGSRGAGLLFSTVGYGLLSAGAFVGGEEVYDIGYGVNHTAFQHGPGEFTPVLPEAQLPENTPTKVEAGGVAVLLVKQNGRIYGLDDTCVHAGCSLAGGQLKGASIVCPCHGSQYNLSDGTVINGPATMPEPTYEVRILNGMIEVRQAS